MASPPGGKPVPKVFVRQATGLVRSLSLFDAISSNLAIINVASALTFPVLLIAFTFPQANIPLAVLFTVPPILLYNGVYSLFSRAMPRSGGEYIYISRALHPGLGYAANFSFAMWNMFWIGVYGNWTSTIGLSTLFYTLGLKQGSSSLQTFGSSLAGGQAGFVAGTVMIILVSAGAIWGLKKIITAQNIAVIIGFIGTIAGLVLVLSSSNAVFVSSFNQHASTSYANIISSAAKSNYFTPGQAQTLQSTILATGLVALTMLFGQFSVYVGGEVKQAKRNLPTSIIVTTFLTAFFLILGGLAITNVFGSNFVGAVQAEYYAPSSSSTYPFGVAPYFNFFASLLTNNVFLIILIGLGFTLWTAAGGIFNLVTNSRCILSWSFDRVFPDVFGRVSDRFHTPVFAIVITAILAEIFLGLYSFAINVVSFMAGTTLGYVLTFGSTAIAAIAFPFRKSTRAIFEGSGADKKVVGVPLIALLGVGTLVYFVVLSYALITNMAFGVNSATSLIAIASFWILGLGLYVVYYFYRKSRGVDLSKAYSELPPE